MIARFFRKASCQFSNRNDVDLRGVLTSQNNPFKAGRKYAFRPLASSWQRLWWWNYHKHIVISLNYSHYAHRASFLDISVNITGKGGGVSNQLTSTKHKAKLATESPDIKLEV